VALVRFFSLYGPGLRKQLLWDAGRKFLRGEARFLGTGEEVRDWLHVTDAARLMLLAGEHAASPGVVVNGGSGEGRSVRQVLSELRACFSEVPPLSFSSEAKAGDPVAYVASSAKMSAWGFRPGVALSDGVREYASWLQREGS
jgi:UDP-glucose 4-epimerase